MNGKSVGFISAYLPPGKPETVFVWQVAVAGSMRGHGLAMRMMRELLARPGVAECRYLETTVTPSNTASRRLFESLARMLGTTMRERVLFKGSDFGEAQHEPEVLFTIGPLTGRT
jgi:L-2,4-diaminobutyric acid acetyltransferase